MIRLPNRFHALCLLCLLPLPALAQAPVVDDSENYAIFDEQQTARRPSVANDYSDNEDIALARDNESDYQGQAELLNKLKGMQQDIQELRGQLEVQSHELAVLKQQQLSFYNDLNTRLSSNTNQPTVQAIEKPTELKPNPTQQAVFNATNTPAVITSRTNPAEEQISYLAAYDLVKNKRFDEALIAMQTFVAHYPNGGYTANAQYWLGELYMVQKDWSKAIEHFEIVLNHFSTSSKAAACSLKIGYALAASGKKNQARQRLQQVINNYPDTPTAQLAATKLKTIGSS